MSTNLEIIGDALGLIGVLSEGETASAEQGEHGLRILNDLLAEWAANGIDVGYFPQVSTTEDFPGSYTVRAAVKHGLAVALAPHYRVQIDPVLGALAGSYYSRLLREAVKANMVESNMDHLPSGQGWGGQYDIVNDV